MHELEKAMLNILNGQATKVSTEVLAISKIIKAAELLDEAGFESEAKVVLGTLKETIKKQASIQEEELFEVTI